jgi:hypothetical protein
MKILITTMARSGSKLLQHNIELYLKSFGSTLNVDFISPGPTRGLGEFFVGKGKDNQYLKKANIDAFGQLFFEEFDNPIDVDDENNSRINILKQTSYNFVVKCLEMNVSIIDELAPLMDRVYILKRDKQQCILSNIVSRYTNIYSIEQLNKVDRKITFTVDKSIVEEYKIKYDNFYKRDRYKNAIDINFEDLINLNDSSEFCKLLYLTHNTFEFFKNTTKFGDHKFAMIENIDQVISWINDRE